MSQLFFINWDLNGVKRRLDIVINVRLMWNGRRVVIGVPWLGHCGGRCLFPLRSMANLWRHFHSTHSLLPHFRRLRLLPVSLSLSLLHFCFFNFNYFISLFCRRFVGAVFGPKCTDAVLSVEYYCCDRPNPLLQVLYYFHRSSFCFDSLLQFVLSILM